MDEKRKTTRVKMETKGSLTLSLDEHWVDVDLVNFSPGGGQIQLKGSTPHLSLKHKIYFKSPKLSQIEHISGQIEWKKEIGKNQKSFGFSYDIKSLSPGFSNQIQKLNTI